VILGLLKNTFLPCLQVGRSERKYMDTISFVIINWNTKELLEKCILAVYSSTNTPNIIVTDNGSIDGSSGMVKNKFPKVRLIANSSNLGFGAAVNQAIKSIKTKYILILNTDTVINKQAVERMAGFMESNPNAGLCTPILLREDGSVQDTFGPYPSLLTEIIGRPLLRRLLPNRFTPHTVNALKPKKTAVIRGACLMARRIALEDVGGFDERYFLFFEETDLCFKMNRRGYGIWYLPDINVYHMSGRSADTEIASARIEYWRSRYIFFRTYYPLWKVFILRLVLMAKLLIDWILNFVGSIHRLCRQKLRTYSIIIIWHILGCPVNWGIKDFRIGVYFKRILIIKLSSFGDIIQGLPVGAVLHRRFPGVKITWILNQQYKQIAEFASDIDKVIPFQRKRWGKIVNLFNTLIEFRRFISSIQAQHFDAVLDMQGLFRSGLIAFLSRIPVRIGFQDAREGASLFYNYKVKVPYKRENAVERYLSLTEYMGCGYNKPVFNIQIPNLSPMFRNVQSAYIIISPGARWQTKRWPAQQFVKLIGRLKENYKFGIVLIGDRKDRAIANDIIGQLKNKVVDLTGKTSLLELAWVLKKSILLVTGDSGPMHLANALDKPVVALFGPTDPGRTGPLGKGNRIIKGTVPCSPCFQKKCKDIRCMDAITVEDVFTAVTDIINQLFPS